MKPPIPDPKSLKLESTDEKPSPLLNINAFLLCSVLGGSSFWHVDDIWFYAHHRKETLKISAVIALVLDSVLFILLSSRGGRKPKEIVLSALFGFLLAFEVVVFYALYIPW